MRERLLSHTADAVRRRRRLAAAALVSRPRTVRDVPGVVVDGPHVNRARQATGMRGKQLYLPRMRPEAPRYLSGRICRRSEARYFPDMPRAKSRRNQSVAASRHASFAGTALAECGLCAAAEALQERGLPPRRRRSSPPASSYLFALSPLFDARRSRLLSPSSRVFRQLRPPHAPLGLDLLSYRPPCGPRAAEARGSCSHHVAFSRLP